MNPLVSVIICTYNRCESLGETLHALKRQALREGLVMEILVVDNNSTDRTRQVVEEAAAHSPWHIRYTFERRQGKAYAENRGIQEAQGEVLAFTDDDVIPDQRWVQTVYEALKTHHADGVGGRVLPRGPLEPPQWMVDYGSFFGVLALVDRGPEPIVCTERDGHLVYGANMTYRKDLFKELGLFRTDCGPIGRWHVGGGDDTEFAWRVVRAGKRLVYTPDAIVYHKVPAERMRKSYFRRWKFCEGRTEVRLSGRSRRGIPGWVLRECAEYGLRALGSYARGRGSRGFEHELRCWSRCGTAVEFLMQRGRQATVVSRVAP